MVSIQTVKLHSTIPKRTIGSARLARVLKDLRDIVVEREEFEYAWMLDYDTHRPTWPKERRKRARRIYKQNILFNDQPSRRRNRTE